MRLIVMEFSPVSVTSSLNTRPSLIGMDNISHTYRARSKLTVYSSFGIFDSRGKDKRY